MTAADLWALADRPAPPVIPGQLAIEVPARCTCARSWGLHSRDCQRWTPGHELIAHPEPLFDLGTEPATSTIR